MKTNPISLGISISRTTILRLGTRASLLARVQSQQVADAIERIHPGVRVELVICRTTGDKIADRPLASLGGKGLFTRELELALLRREIDFAVHSFKDVPVTMPLVEEAQSRLAIAAVPAREDARDVLATVRSLSPNQGLEDLPRGATVGTGSLRRRCQLLAVRPDLNVHAIRGNVDTRLKKLIAGDFDAIVLAAAGLRRSGLFNDSFMTLLPVDAMLPAAAQGALAVQCRRSDRRTADLLSALDDAPTRTCVELERAVIAALGSDCSSPIAALATIEGGRIRLRAVVGAAGGSLPVIQAEASADVTRPEHALRPVLSQLAGQSAFELLHGEIGREHHVCAT